MAQGKRLTQKEKLEQRAKELELDVVKRDGSAGEPTIEDFQYAIGVAEGALVPDDPATKPAAEKTYIVTGSQEVEGTAPGGNFVAAFTPEKEAALLEGGHIAIVQPIDDDEEKES